MTHHDLLPEVLYEQAQKLMLNGDYARAAVLLQKAIGQNEDLAVLWNALGICMERLEMPREALLAYSRAAQLQRFSHRATLQNVWRAAFEQRQWDVLVQCFEGAVRAGALPEQPYWYNYVAIAYYKTGKLDKAELSILRALELAPTEKVYQDSLLKIRSLMRGEQQG